MYTLNDVGTLEQPVVNEGAAAQENIPSEAVPPEAVPPEAVSAEVIPPAEAVLPTEAASDSKVSPTKRGRERKSTTNMPPARPSRTKKQKGETAQGK